MFKEENDRKTGKLLPDAPAKLALNPNSIYTQFVINTDATVGNLLFSFKSRNSIADEPLPRSDGLTQVDVDLSTTERTVVFDVGLSLQELSAIASGMDGTFYEIISSSGEVNA